MAKNTKGPNLNLFGGIIVLAVLVIGVLVTNSQLNNTQDVRQEAAGKKITTASTTASIVVADPNPQLGKSVHFTYTLPAGVKEDPTGSGTQARIQVMCTQPVPFTYTDSNGVTNTQTDPTVYGEAYNAIDLRVGSQGLLLGGGGSVWLWHGGSANCVATLYQWLYNGQQTFNPFATVNFTAAGK